MKKNATTAVLALLVAALMLPTHEALAGGRGFGNGSFHGAGVGGAFHDRGLRGGEFPRWRIQRSRIWGYGPGYGYYGYDGYGCDPLYSDDPDCSD
jgi:hypothetical protein